MASEEAVDWRTGLSLLQRQKYMLEGQYGADVTFLVGQGKHVETIRAHRFPLVCGSAIMENMLERQSPDAMEPITVEDVEPATFREMLRYLYEEEVNISQENVMKVRFLAQKFGVVQLTEMCLDFYEDNISVDTVCEVLDGSVTNNENALTMICINFISNHTSQVIKSSEFCLLSSASLAEVLKADSLQNVSEIDLYEASLRWADAECLRRGKSVDDANRRSVLGDAIFHVRFPTMDVKIFAQVTHRSELLSESEKLALFNHIALHAGEAKDCDCNIKAITRKRCHVFHPVTVTRCLAVYKGHKVSGSNEAIDFVCNKPAELTAVGLFGIHKNCGESDMIYSHNVHVKLLNKAGSVLADTGRVLMMSHGSELPVRVDLPKPIFVVANSRYTLDALLTGPNTYVGKNGAVSVTSGDFTVNFKDSKRRSANTTVSRGQIPILYFTT